MKGVCVSAGEFTQDNQQRMWRICMWLTGYVAVCEGGLCLCRRVHPGQPAEDVENLYVADGLCGCV